MLVGSCGGLGMAKPNYSAGLGLLPTITENRCLVCSSTHRPMIDKLLVAGFSNVTIAEELQRVDENFRDKVPATVRKNVSRHADRHVNVKDRAIRRIIEKRAAEQGMLIDEVEGQIATSRSLLDLMVAKGHDQLSDPDYRVRMADVIEATKMVEDVQRQEYVQKVEVMTKQVWAISQALQLKVKDPIILAEIVELAGQLFENPDLVDSGELSEKQKEMVEAV